MRYKLESTEILKPQTIQLRFAGGAWVRMTFTEVRPKAWHVQINSDWGSWEHFWDAIGSVSIFQFVLQDKNYIWRKFTSGEARITDEEGTKRSIRKAVREHFGNNYWGNREEWDNTMNMINGLNDFDNIGAFFNQLELECLPEELRDEFWRYYQDMDHPRSTFFFKRIYPKLAKHIRKLGRENDRLHKRERAKAPKVLSDKLKGSGRCRTPPQRL